MDPALPNFLRDLLMIKSRGGVSRSYREHLSRAFSSPCWCPLSQGETVLTFLVFSIFFWQPFSAFLHSPCWPWCPLGLCLWASSFSAHKPVSQPYFSPCPTGLSGPSISYLLIHRPDCRAPEYISQGNLPALGLQGESLRCQRRERFPKGSEPWALQG